MTNVQGCSQHLGSRPLAASFILFKLTQERLPNRFIQVTCITITLRPQLVH